MCFGYPSRLHVRKRQSLGCPFFVNVYPISLNHEIENFLFSFFSCVDLFFIELLS